MTRALAFAAALSIALPLAAAPRIEDASDCYLFADLALTAAAAAKHGVARETFDAIAADVYEFPTPPQQELARLVTDAAWRAAAAGDVPGAFASRFHIVCRVRRGNVDSIIGTSL